MRILMVHPGPAFAVADVFDGWHRALGRLAEVRTFDLGGRMSFHEQALRAAIPDEDRRAHDSAHMAAEGLRAACLDWWPDLVLVVSSFFVPQFTYEVLRARGIRVACLFTESPYEDDSQVRIAAHVDLAVVNDPTNLDRFQAATKAIYLPHAYDPEVHRLREPRPECRSDFCFVGTGYPSRIEFFEAVDFAGVDVALAGNWQALDPASPLVKFVAHDLDVCCANDTAHDLYAATKVSANIYRREAARPELEHGWAMGPREVELAAAGTFFLTEPRGENREVLPMVPTFDGPDDFAEQLRWWLDHDQQRLDVATRARAAVEHRTFDAHARLLLSQL